MPIINTTTYTNLYSPKDRTTSFNIGSNAVVDGSIFYYDKKAIFQPFDLGSQTYDITKISSYINLIKNNSSILDTFNSSDIDRTLSIDASNFIKLDQGNPYVLFTKSIYGYTGYGCMYISSPVSGSTSYPVFHYPIKVNKPSKYTIYFRVQCPTSSFTFDVFINDDFINTYSLSVTSGSWSTPSIDIDIPYTSIATISIRPKVSNFYFDSIYINHFGKNITFSGFNNNYITVNMSVFKSSSVLSNCPTEQLPVHDYICYFPFNPDYSKFNFSDWYNFNCKLLKSYSVSDTTSGTYFSVSYSQSGYDKNLYSSWDNSKENTNLSSPMYFYIDSWNTIDNYYQSVKVYKNYYGYNSSEKEFITTPAEQVNALIEDFNQESGNPVSLNTEIYVVNSSKNNIKLSLSNRILSFVLDQSGSMTWNDNQGIRHEYTKSIIKRLKDGYPGDISYNLISYGGLQIKSSVGGYSEQVRQTKATVSDIESNFYSGINSLFGGVRVVRNKDNFPVTPNDGDIVFDGFASSFYDSNLITNDEYYYTVYTYSPGYRKFSSGTQIKVTPKSRILPRAVSDFSYKIYDAYGTWLDNNIKLLMPMTDGFSGDIYDFSSSNLSMYSITNAPDPVKSDTYFNTPFGKNCLRYDGISTFSYVNDTNNQTRSSNFTVGFFIKPYQKSSKSVIIKRGDNSGSDWEIGINSDKIYFSNQGNICYSSSSVNYNLWSNIFVTVSRHSNQVVNIYINGLLDSTHAISYSAYNGNNIYVGSSLTSGSNYYFGLIQDLSVSNIVRDSNYIASVYQKSATHGDKINGSRLIVLSYIVPADYNYSSLRIVRKYGFGSIQIQDNYDTYSSVKGNEEFEDIILPQDPSTVFYGNPPSHEYDGDIIYDSTVTPGNYRIAVPDTYIANFDYYFRAFTFNSHGNYSNIKDSPLLSIKTDHVSSMDGIYSPLNSVPNIISVVIDPGIGKNYLQWAYSNTNNIAKKIEVYSSTKDYIIFDQNSSQQENLKPIYISDSISNDFVNNFITNDVKYYYTIIASDEFGRRSDAFYISSIPSETANESSIPLENVVNLSYEIINYEDIALYWDNPIKIIKSVSAYYDEQVVIFGKIVDSYGRTITNLNNVELKVDLVKAISSGLAEDVFRGNPSGDPSFILGSNFYTASYSLLPDGTIKSIVRLNAPLSTLSEFKYVTFKAYLMYSIQDTTSSFNETTGKYSDNIFEYYSRPIKIKFKNPWEISINNLNNSMVKHVCKCVDPSQIVTGSSQLGNDTDLNQTTTTRDFQGCYVRKTGPIVYRIIASYKNRSIPQGIRVLCSLNQASDPDCSDDFVPGYTLLKSNQVSLPNDFTIQNGSITKQDGTTVSVSYVDIPIYAPRIPEADMLFVECTYNGFTDRKKQYIVFENILKMEIQAQNPIANCADVAEQQASVWMIDPDYPDDPTRITVVPNQTLVKWSLECIENCVNRPFYSTEATGTGSISSFINNGVARNIFFGPACNVQFKIEIDEQNGVKYIPERYRVVATSFYDDLAIEDCKIIEIFPLNPADGGLRRKFLMELPSFTNDLWADGEDKLKLTINHNPLIQGTQFSTCFVSCIQGDGGNIWELSPGQNVYISGDEFEMAWGDNISYTTNILNNVVTPTNCNKAIAPAYVGLSTTNNYTEVYLSMNKQLTEDETNNPDDGNTQLIVNPCSCLGDIINVGQGKKGIKVLRGNTTVIQDSEEIYITAGGDLRDGIPPTRIKLKEPLFIKIQQLRANGLPVEDLVIDGITYHQLVIEISFSGNPVPDGTPVFIEISGKNPEVINISSNIVYTSQVNDTYLNPTGAKRSIAYLDIPPFQPQRAFNVTIFTKSTYDKRGDAIRLKKDCVSFNYQQGKRPAASSGDITSQINYLFNSVMYSYDISSGKWNTLNSMTIGRGGIGLDQISGKIYASGGLTTNAILNTLEIYDIASNTWTRGTNLNKPRFAHVSTAYNGKVYVFGGVTVSGSDTINEPTLERYTPGTDIWETINTAPHFELDSNGTNKIYSVSFANSKVINNKWYIFCGIRTFRSGKIEELNDRVLEYNFVSNSWNTYDAGVDTKRLGAFSILDSNNVNILSGSNPGVNSEIDLISSLDSSFIFDSLTDIVHDGDYIYGKKPVNRSFGAGIDIAGVSYLSGGSTEESKSTTIFEKVQKVLGIYQATKITNMPKGLRNHGISYYNNKIYVCGGFTSGRNPGFLKINMNYSTDPVSLDGKESISLDITVTDESGSVINGVNGSARGYLVFGDGVVPQSANAEDSTSILGRQALIYPVVFSSPTFTIQNNKSSVTIQPRSEDILKKIQDIKDKLGITNSLASESQQAVDKTYIVETGTDRLPYKIKVQVIIEDSYYYGETEFTINSNSGLTSGSGNSITGYDILDALLSKLSIDSVRYNAILMTGGATLAIPTPSGPYTVIQGSRVLSNSEVVEAARLYTDALVVSNTEADFLTWLRIYVVDNVSVVVPPDPGTEGCRRFDASFSTGSSSSNGSDNNNTGITRFGGYRIDSTNLLVFPSKEEQIVSPDIQYYSNIEWIPYIKRYFDSNTSTYDDIINDINKISEEIPFGSSQTYDALQMISEITSDSNYYDIAKSIYLNTDNEQNLSYYNNIDTIISNINVTSISGSPVIINNYSVVSPTTLSALASRTDTESIEKISTMTGGQSQSILTSSLLSDLVNNSMGAMVGSIGYGKYSYTYDLKESSYINSIKSNYVLFSNTSGNWTFSYSDDGYNYTEYGETLSANTVHTISNVYARYIRFTWNLYSNIISSSSSSNTTPAGIPYVDTINIVYSKKAQSFLYFESDSIPSAVYEVSISLHADKPETSDIFVGMSPMSSNNWTWKEFDTNSNPAIGRYGRLILPIRQEIGDASINEKLDKISDFVFKARYGEWSENAKVLIKDSSGNIITDYKTYPRKGVVVFSSRKNSDMFITIQNVDKFKIGVNIINKSTDPAIIKGIGYMFTTNKEMPIQVSKREPEINSALISPSLIDIYTKVSADYTYFDISGNIESGSIIKWYINGTENRDLQNLKSWNDVSNSSDPIWNYISIRKSDIPSGSDISDYLFSRNTIESILKAGDIVYYTIQPSDGVNYGSIYRSQSSIVSPRKPKLSEFSLILYNSSSQVSNTITSSGKIKANYVFITDLQEQNNSIITWYVNGTEFKSGVIGTVDSSGIPLDEIRKSETVSGVVGISYGNTIYASIKMIFNSFQSDTYETSTITVSNDIPVVSSVSLSPASPIQNSAISISYTIVDYDIQVNASGQSDQSTIAWFKSTMSDGQYSSFIEVVALRNKKEIPGSYVQSGQKWKAKIIPFDGISVGTSVESSEVIVN